MPFGLQIHMAAAHGPNNVKHQLRSTQGGDAPSPISGKRRHPKRRQGKPFGKKARKPVRPAKRF